MNTKERTIKSTENAFCKITIDGFHCSASVLFV